MRILLSIALCLLGGLYAEPSGSYDVRNRGSIPNLPEGSTWNGKYPHEKIREELDTNDVNNRGNERNVASARSLEEESNDDDESVYDDGDPVARTLQFPNFIPQRQSYDAVEIEYPGTSNVAFPTNKYLPPLPGGYQSQPIIGYPGTYPNSPVIGTPGRLPSGPIVNQLTERPGSQAVANLLAQLLQGPSRPRVVIVDGRRAIDYSFLPLIRPPYPPLGGSYYRPGGGQSPPIRGQFPSSAEQASALGRQFSELGGQIPPLNRQIPSSGEGFLPSPFDFELNSKIPRLDGQVLPLSGQLGGQFIPPSGRQQYQQSYSPRLIPHWKSQVIPYTREPPAKPLIEIDELPLLIKQSPLSVVGTPLLPHSSRLVYYPLEQTGPPTSPAHIVGQIYNPPGQMVGGQIAQGPSEAENEQIAHVQNYRNEKIKPKSNPSSEQSPARNPNRDDEEAPVDDDIFDAENDPNEDDAINRRRALRRKGEHRPQNNEPHSYRRSGNNLPPSYRYGPGKRSAMFEPVKLDEEQ